MKIDAYYKMVMLSEEERTINKIRAKQRFDCVSYSKDYEGIKPFISHKGMFYLNLTSCKEFISTKSKRKFSYSFTIGA